MNKDELVIATISLARSDEEEVLLKASLSQLSLLGIPVVVADGGSPRGFVNFLQSLPNFTVLSSPSKGVFAQAKTSLLEAAKTEKPFIFYTESDKEFFFKDGLPTMIETIDVNEATGVILASRSAKGFASFPAFQQTTETTINHCCKEAIGLKTDYCYGPFVLNTKMVAQLEEVPEDIGWGWRPFVFNTAHWLGYDIKTFEDDFLCPEAQRQDDAAERIYRMKQLEQNIRGLLMSNE